MADYFTRFSLVVALPDEAAQNHALQIAEQARMANSGDELAAEFPDTLKDLIEDWSFETEIDQSPFGLWLHSDYGGVDAACAFIQHLLQKFNPSGRITFEWSNDCSKPRVDAYGGGAVIVTANKIKSMSTYAWLQKHAPAQPKEKS